MLPLPPPSSGSPTTRQFSPPTRLIAFILLLLLTSVGVVAGLGYASARSSLKAAALAQLQGVQTSRVKLVSELLQASRNEVLALSGLPQAMVAAMTATGFGFYAFLAVYVLVVLFLGTIIDSSSIMLIMLPLSLPVVASFNADLIWFGIVTVIAVEVGLLTPPFGLSVYVIKSTLNDPRIGLGDIFRGSFPFVVMMLAVLLLVIAFPKLSLVLL